VRLLLLLLLLLLPDDIVPSVVSMRVLWRWRPAPLLLLWL
jgi:hypothetical protein